MASLPLRCLRPHLTSGPLSVPLALSAPAPLTVPGFSSAVTSLWVASPTSLLKAAAASTSSLDFLPSSEIYFPIEAFTV